MNFNWFVWNVQVFHIRIFIISITYKFIFLFFSLIIYLFNRETIATSSFKSRFFFLIIGRMKKARSFLRGSRLFLLGQSSLNSFSCRQMATFVSRWPMENGCARVVRAPGVQSIRELETCRERKPDLWLRFPWTFVILGTVAKSSWQVLLTTQHWTVLAFIPPVSVVFLLFQTPPSATSLDTSVFSNFTRNPLSTLDSYNIRAREWIKIKK